MVMWQHMFSMSVMLTVWRRERERVHVTWNSIPVPGKHVLSAPSLRPVPPRLCSNFGTLIDWKTLMSLASGVCSTYLLTPWSRVLLEKLTGSAASQEIPRVFGTRRFLTVFTSARHLSLFWANSIQSPQPPPTSWRSILIPFSHLRLGLPNGLFTSGFPTWTLCTPLPSPNAPHAPPISFFSILPPTQYWVRGVCSTAARKSTDVKTLH